MVDDMLSSEQRRLHDELWKVVERNIGLWEDDEAMDDRRVAATLMMAAAAISGEMLGLVVSTMGMKQKGALERGADLIHKGAIVAASLIVQKLEKNKCNQN